MKDGFPSTRSDERWPGAWKWGQDYSADAATVIAVRAGYEGEIKHPDWVGPVTLTDESAALLERWAEYTLHLYGGYVHLFPADGTDSGSLQQWASDQDDD